jgi:FkbM family methyltransferase
MNLKLIYDVGMGEGDDTAFYLHLGYNVIAVEANPEMIEKTNKRFAAEIAAGKVVIVPKAVSESENQQDFYLYAQAPENNSLIQHDQKTTGKITVPTTRFKTILEKYGVPFYLKVDIEGSEALVIRDLSRDDLPQYVSIEMWGIDSICQLYALGYRKFKVVNQPKLSNTTFNGWTFRHSSGPFGEDAPGTWAPLDRILLQWLKYLAHEQSTFLDGVWYDLHASL